MNLFYSDLDLKIRRITAPDVKLQTDSFNLLRLCLQEHESMYPNIMKWFKDKVAPGIRSGERVGYLGLINDLPKVTGVVKIGEHSKFCHLSINKEYYQNHIGELFFAMMTLDVRNLADTIHFSLPESLWTEKSGFFNSFGFNSVSKFKKQYRTSDEELLCRASFTDVWQKTLEKLPKIVDANSHGENNPLTGILLSVRPNFLNQIQKGEKLVEVRKKFNPKWVGRRVTFYSTHPVKELWGYAKIGGITHNLPEKIWEAFHESMGCSKKEFDQYVGVSRNEKIYALHLVEVKPYISPIQLNYLCRFINNDTLKAPQSYSIIEKNQEWKNALSVADLLQGRFTTQLRNYC